MTRAAAERVKDVTRMLQEKGAWVTEVRSPGSSTVELEVGYQTQQPDFPALSRLLDRCKETPAVEMRETGYACLVRREVRQLATEASSAPDKALVSPAPVGQQPAQEYDDD
ncbi:MAG: hypothetical protein ACRYG7_46750 [Janthinobacterium lividum]